MMSLFRILVGVSLLGCLDAVPRGLSPIHKSIRSKVTASSTIFGTRGGSSYAPPQDEYEIPGMPGERETVQDRVDAWRRQQEEIYSQEYKQSAEATANPRDADGRMKLTASVSKGARALIFFILMWRGVHLYEVADQTFNGFFRGFIAVPLIVLFIANMAGVVSSFTSPSHSAKKRLKAILNLNKLVEILMICFNLMRLTIFPSKYTPREMYIANTLHSVFFILQSQCFTKVSWDEIHVVSGSTSAAAAETGGNRNPYAAYQGAKDAAESAPQYEATPPYGQEQQHHYTSGNAVPYDQPN